MKSVYEKIRTPYKYGSVLKFDVMFYFRFEAGKGAYDTFAVSDDLIHWTKWEEEPLVFCEYEWENVHAHKPWVICVDGTVYHYYCAVNDKNERYIALAASRPLQ